jgi:hypothetical protein
MIEKDVKKDLFLGLFGSFVVSTAYLLYQGVGVKKALFGFLYFLITPFLAIYHLPISLVVVGVLFLLFRRATSCMRFKYRWIAYLVLWLHLLAWGLYSSTQIK